MKVTALFYDDDSIYEAEILGETKTGFNLVFSEYGNKQDTEVADITLKESRSCVYISTYMCICVYIPISHMYTYVYIIHVYIHVYIIYVYVYMYMSIHTDITHVYMCILYIYIHMCIRVSIPISR